MTWQEESSIINSWDWTLKRQRTIAWSKWNEYSTAWFVDPLH
jgi:hypothetical protein